MKYRDLEMVADKMGDCRRAIDDLAAAFQNEPMTDDAWLIVRSRADEVGEQQERLSKLIDAIRN